MYKGIAANKIVRLNLDELRQLLLLELFSDNGVNVIKVASNGDIMVGGSFSKKYNGTDVNRLVLLDSMCGFDMVLDLQVLQFIL
jgi:hypothetical protein